MKLINYAKCRAGALIHHKVRGCFFKQQLVCTKQLAYSNTGSVMCTLKILWTNLLAAAQNTVRSHVHLHLKGGVCVCAAVECVYTCRR